jgi:hypothetical protein
LVNQIQLELELVQTQLGLELVQIQLELELVQIQLELELVQIQQVDRVNPLSSRTSSLEGSDCSVSEIALSTIVLLELLWRQTLLVFLRGITHWKSTSLETSAWFKMLVLF